MGNEYSFQNGKLYYVPGMDNGNGCWGNAAHQTSGEMLQSGLQNQEEEQVIDQERELLATTYQLL